MSGSLVLIDEEIVSSAVASVTLTGIDSTYDVYMVRVNNAIPTTDSTQVIFRVTESGTPNSTANYDRAGKLLRTSTSFANFSSTNQTEGRLTGSTLGTGGNESANGIVYIFNANNSSEYTFFTQETVSRADNGELRGGQSGTVFTSTSSVNGIQFLCLSGNIDSGTFTLYGLKK